MDEIIQNLEKAILEYDNAGAKYWAEKAVESNINPLETMNVLTRAIRQVGDGYAGRPLAP